MDIKEEIGGFWGLLVTGIAVSASIFHIFALGLVATGMWQLRVIHLLVVLILGPIIYRSAKKRFEEGASWIDIVMIIAGIAATMYALLEEEGLALREDVAPTWGDIFFGTILLVLIMELTRRAMGWPLVILILVFMGYSLFAYYLPGPFRSKSYDYARIISHLFSIDGFYGIPIGASATYCYLFILFGSFLRASRVGDFFMDISYALAGRTRGGPAKVAIFGSGLMGTISGSGIANVVTTGTFTIPLMKQTGFSPRFAAAVEAAASTGGQIMPPVMGAAAFLMAEYTSIPYNKIVIAAAIPAILYYIAIYFMVDFEAAKGGLKGLLANELPSIKETILKWGHLSIPFFVLLYELLIVAASPIRAALLSMFTSFIVSWVRQESRIGLWKLIGALKGGAIGSLEVIAACSAAGIIVGLVSLTGMAIKLSDAIIALSGGQVLVALILSMTITLILSMGLPTTGAYVIAAIVIGPALTKLGIPLLSAHMFIFYYACMSGVTPPVALCAYAAAGIAGANPIQVGFTAWRLSITAFVVPYMFIYGPALLCEEPIISVIWAGVTAIIGVISLSASMSGWFLASIAFWQRILFGAAGLALIFPGGLTDSIGFGSMLFGIGIQIYRIRKRREINGELAGG